MGFQNIIKLLKSDEQNLNYRHLNLASQIHLHVYSPFTAQACLLFLLLPSTGTLKGMHETSGKLTTNTDQTAARTAIMEAANVAQVPSADSQILKFASVTFSSGLPVLVTVTTGSKVIVNSEKMVINSMLLKTVKGAVENA